MPKVLDLRTGAVKIVKIVELYLFGYVTLTTHSPPYTKTESTIFLNTLTNRTRT